MGNVPLTGEAVHVKGQELHGKSLFSSQFCCEPKTTAKILVSQEKRENLKLLEDTYYTKWLTKD